MSLRRGHDGKCTNVQCRHRWVSGSGGFHGGNRNHHGVQADTALVGDTGAGEPVLYKFAKKVSYVDVDGKELQAPGLRKNLRVRVHYVRVGGDLTIDKVTLLE